jgi:aminoglycoside phosphotransferase (APT) family kinase protein
VRPESGILVQGLQQEIEAHYPDWRLRGELRIIGQGLEALVCRATTERFGDVAIKVPWTRFESNENDAWVDNRALLRQEALMAQHLTNHGVPVPAIHLLHVEGALDFLISAYIHNDGSEVPSHQLGELLARIHNSPPPPVQAGSLPINLAERIEQRLKVVEQQTGLALPLPPGWQEPLDWSGARQAILHMDFRPANVLSHEGRLRAIVDWSNMLIGDPALELARIAEYENLDEGFLEGYGTKDPFGHLPPGVETLYRLDTAVMLAVVFLSEAPDLDLARRQVDRVQALYRRIIAES